MELAVYYYPPEGGLEFVLKGGCAMINSNIVDGDFGTIKIEHGMNYRDLVAFIKSQVSRRQKADFFNLVQMTGRTYSLNIVNGGTKSCLNPEEAEIRLKHYEDVYRRILRC